jgi:hypothetical protein
MVALLAKYQKNHGSLPSYFSAEIIGQVFEVFCDLQELIKSLSTYF